MQRKARRVEVFRRTVATVVALAMTSQLCLVQPARAEEASADPALPTEVEASVDEGSAEADEAVAVDDSAAVDDSTVDKGMPVEEGAAQDEEPIEDVEDVEVPDTAQEESAQDTMVPEQNDAEVEPESEAEDEPSAEQEEAEAKDPEATTDEEALLAEAEGATGTTFTVTDAAFGANGSDSKSDADAINKALAKALEAGGAHITVRVPSGTYYLDKPLEIWSNTSLVCDANAKLCATFPEASVLRNRHLNADGSKCLLDSSCKHGGYSQTHDIVVEGGVWDRDPNKKFAGSSNGLFALRHGENITIRNLTVMNATNHIINVSASRHVVIEGVTCKDNIKYTGKDKDYWLNFAVGDANRFKTIEAIHADFANAEGEPSLYPQDETPSVDVTVKNCTFTDVFAGVGNHHDGAKGKMQQVNIDNCTFSGLVGACADFYSAADCSLTNCTATNVQCLAYMTGASNCTVSDNEISKFTDVAVTAENYTTGAVISGNTIPNATGNAIYVARNSSATVTGNTISNAGEAAVRVNSNSSATVSGNTISSPKTFGISTGGKSTVTCENNKITSPGKTGLYCEASTMKAKGNTVSGGSTSAMTLSASTNCTFEKNTFSGATDNGVFVSGCTGITLTGNTIENAAKSGVRVTDKSTVTLTNNTINAPKEHGISVGGSSKVTANGNTIKNAGQHGVYLNQAASGCSITSNKVYAAKGTGILVYNTVSATVSSNTVTDCTGNGIGVLGDSVTTSATVKGNTSTSKTVSGKDIYVGAGVKNTVVENNAVGARGIGTNSSSSVTVRNNTVSIAGATVSGISNQSYTGKAITPNPTLKFGSTTLKKGTDYTLSYKNNVKIGTATITITGKGNFKGTLSKTFRIVFKDVPTSHRFFEKVHLAAQNDLIAGYSGSKTGMFGPSDNITRGQIAVILWRMAGKPAAGKNAKSFPDVKSGAYYYNAVRWASSTGVVSGYNTGEFGPDDNITRQQLAVMVANYAKKIGGIKVSGKASDYAKYSDHAKVASYAAPSMGWCCAKGIFVDESGKLNPTKYADRATAAQMAYDLYKLMK